MYKAKVIFLILINGYQESEKKSLKKNCECLFI